METTTPILETATKGKTDPLPRYRGPVNSASRPERRGVQLAMHQMLHHLREGRNLGPLSVLLAVLIYSLLSPHLPAPIHDFIYHIAH
jgi:hypothetical protein